MYKVLILEDDPMVAQIDERYTRSTPGFTVTGSFRNGVDALAFLKDNDADLIILDYFMPNMNGDVFLKHLHSMEKYPCIIMVTSANDAEIIRKLLLRGVSDYLVKPFEYERFREALRRFKDSVSLMENASGEMDQKDIDSLLGNAKTDAPKTSMLPLPKGLNTDTLSLIRDRLKSMETSEFTVEQAADKVGLSRITVKRYINYLMDNRELISRVDYGTGGRPGLVYRLMK